MPKLISKGNEWLAGFCVLQGVLQVPKLISKGDEWLAGFCVALAEVHRIGKQTSTVVEAARCAGVTLDLANQAGVDAYDVDELQRAGIT
jgi:hypothetical protein